MFAFFIIQHECIDGARERERARERWCEGEWGDEKKTLLLTLEEFLLLSSILKSGSSFAFTGWQNNGRVNLCCVTDFLDVVIG